MVAGAGLIDTMVVMVDAANDLAMLKAAGKFSPLPVVASRIRMMLFQSARGLAVKKRQDGGGLQRTGGRKLVLTLALTFLSSPPGEEIIIGWFWSCG